jgi:hypothetical protein
MDQSVGEEIRPKRAKSCRSLAQLVGDIRVAGERMVDEGAQVLELSSERHETIRYSEPGLIAAVMRLPRCGKEHCLCLGADLVSPDVHKQPNRNRIGKQQLFVFGTGPDSTHKVGSLKHAHRVHQA